MKTLILSLLIAASMTASAQRAFPMTPEEDTQVGILLEKSAHRRGEALVIIVGCAAASALLFATNNDTSNLLGPAVLGGGLVAGFALSLSSVNKQAKAGRILQGKPK